jgi:SAM-dependent methyltransferase
MSDVVRRYYDRTAEIEWGRLFRDPYNMLEYIVTMHYLEKHLPLEGLILDAGGGPGRYTVELARRGYEVVLFDLSPVSLEYAQGKIEEAGVEERIRGVVEGSITDLSEFEARTFDAVVCLGPLSHLLERAERETAMKELSRVAKPGAPILVSVIRLYGVFRVVLSRLSDELLDPDHEEMFTKGIHRVDWHEERESGFTEAYFFHPYEVRELMEGAGIETIEMATCEGLSTGLQEATNALYEDREKWDRWIEILLKTSNDPSILGSSDHFLYIGRRK